MTTVVDLAIDLVDAIERFERADHDADSDVLAYARAMAADAEVLCTHICALLEGKGG